MGQAEGHSYPPFGAEFLVHARATNQNYNSQPQVGAGWGAEVVRAVCANQQEPAANTYQGLRDYEQLLRAMVEDRQTTRLGHPPRGHVGT